MYKYNTNILYFQVSTVNLAKYTKSRTRNKFIE